MSKVCVFFGTGFEEIEALTVVDILRRAGIETDMVSVMDQRTVMGSHQIPVVIDKLLSEVDFGSVDVLNGKMVCAICAAPSILGHRGILKGKKAIAYPGFEDQLTGAQVVDEPAVRDGNIITGRGMGCSIPFALEILKYLTDEETAKEMAEKIVYQS